VKVKEARELLDPAVLSGNSLYQRASKLFQEETETRIKLRSHGKPVTRGIVESVLPEIITWFRKATEGLPFSEPGTPEQIIEWETGRTWVRHKLVDPRIEELRKRTRLEMLKGTRFPAFAALTQDSLDAASSMMLAQMQEDFKGVSEALEKERVLAKEMGMESCPWRVEARHCEHCKSYSIAESSLPTSILNVAFLCSLSKDEKCPKFEEVK